MECDGPSTSRPDTEVTISDTPSTSTASVAASTSVPTTSGATSSVECTTEETPRKRKIRTQQLLKNNKLRKLQAKSRHMKKKINTLQELLDNLEKKLYLSQGEKQVLSKFGVTDKELLKTQMKPKDQPIKIKYSSEMKDFALALHFYSPKAYAYVRKTFETYLPHPRILCKWYTNTKGQPGLTKDSVNALKLRAGQEGKEDKILTLFSRK